jgi:hypothetical protein
VTLGVTVYGLPTVGISGNAIICSGDTTNLTANGANTYSWSNNSTSYSISVNPSVTTSYTASGTNTNGCSVQVVKTVTVNARPQLTLSGQHALCAGDSLVLSVSGASTYSWSTGSNSNTVQIKPTIASGNYTFSVLGSSTAGCTKLKKDSILVNAVPSITVNGGSMVCLGNSLTLNASGANTYSWSNGATSNSITVSPTVNTSYSVVGTTTAGCTGLSVNNVTVFTFPTVTISGNTVMCSGDSLSLIVNGANSYSWSTGATNTVIVVKPTTNTSYSVIGFVGVGCSDTAQTNITVNSLPSLTLSAKTKSICEGESVTLLASGASTYSWTNSATTSSILVNPVQTTTYGVVGTDTNSCSSKDSLVINVFKCESVTESRTYGSEIKLYPNPNNGIFNLELPSTTDAEIFVINVLGQQILHVKANQFNRIDLKKFDNGVYFVSVQRDSQLLFNKVVIKE